MLIINRYINQDKFEIYLENRIVWRDFQFFEAESVKSVDIAGKEQMSNLAEQTEVHCRRQGQFCLDLDSD